MSAPARKSGSMPSGSSLKGPKFGATLDLLRVMSSNLFKLDTMLKVHDEADIELRAKLIEALDGVRKVRSISCSHCLFPIAPPDAVIGAFQVICLYQCYLANKTPTHHYSAIEIISLWRRSTPRPKCASRHPRCARMPVAQVSSLSFASVRIS